MGELVKGVSKIEIIVSVGKLMHYYGVEFPRGYISFRIWYTMPAKIFSRFNIYTYMYYYRRSNRIYTTASLTQNICHI